MLVLRMKLPIDVTRGSLVSLDAWRARARAAPDFEPRHVPLMDVGAALTRIERNWHVNGPPPSLPDLAEEDGPVDVSFTSAATARRREQRQERQAARISVRLPSDRTGSARRCQGR